VDLVPWSGVPIPMFRLKVCAVLMHLIGTVTGYLNIT
jgi:hypothetical protein